MIVIRKLQGGRMPPEREAPLLFCDECGSLIQWHSYCPRCGADLTGEDVRSRFLDDPGS